MLNPSKLKIAIALATILAAVAPLALAQATKGVPANSASIPPPGIDVPPADRAALMRDLAILSDEIKGLSASKDAKVKSLLPDVQVYERAVRSALDYNEFFDAKEIEKAKELLAEGRTRAEQLKNGESPWTRAQGLVVRGYISKIDGSVQPIGLVVPESYRPGGNYKFRLDVWLHGRNEKLSEVNFLDERRKQPGQFTPQDTIVLHSYGRYCNAFKFAGEIDVLEGIDAVKKMYRVDDDRVAMRGFSMGGAGCWHLAVHYADHWMAATPGAGFAEYVEYLKLTPEAVDALPGWQKKLLTWYDCPGWAANLYQCPTIAYNGELDKQKQAADVMEKALEKEGIALKRIIGPGTEHKYHPDSKQEIDAAVTSIAEAGRDKFPMQVHMATYTLRYPNMCWVHVQGLGEHWTEARIDTDTYATEDQTVVAVATQNMTDLKLSFPPGWAPIDISKPVQVNIDDQELKAPRAFSDRSWSCELHRAEEGDTYGPWEIGAREAKGLRKRPGLQGPIDDAFMDSFIMVRPTGKSNSPGAQWAHTEMEHAIRQWRRQFRGEARVKDDTAITDEDIASANLILWGDAENNAVIKRIANDLPIRVQGGNVIVDKKTFPAADHVPVFIYPNPLNPQRYVVLNSGVTFREADLSSNAKQVPRLPDWAVIDIRSPHDATYPGKVVAADFFGEKWELNPPGAKTEKAKTAARTQSKGWLGSRAPTPRWSGSPQGSKAGGSAALDPSHPARDSILPIAQTAAR